MVDSSSKYQLPHYVISLLKDHLVRELPLPSEQLQPVVLLILLIRTWDLACLKLTDPRSLPIPQCQLQRKKSSIWLTDVSIVPGTVFVFCLLCMCSVNTFRTNLSTEPSENGYKILYVCHSLKTKGTVQILLHMDSIWGLIRLRTSVACVCV